VDSTPPALWQPARITPDTNRPRSPGCSVWRKRIEGNIHGRRERRRQSHPSSSRGLIGTPDTIRKRVAAYEAAGVQELVLWFPDAAQLDSLRWFANELIL
jgi:hypothetical protein